MGKAVSKRAGTALGKEDTKTQVQAGIRVLPWVAAPTSHPASPPVSIPRMSKSDSHNGNDSKICKGSIWHAPRPAICIARAGKLSPSSPGTSLLQPADFGYEFAGEGTAGEAGVMANLVFSRCRALSKVAELSSTVVIDINEGRKLASEGSANFRVWCLRCLNIWGSLLNS